MEHKTDYFTCPNEAASMKRAFLFTVRIIFQGMHQCSMRAYGHRDYGHCISDVFRLSGGGQKVDVVLKYHSSVMLWWLRQQERLHYMIM